MQNDPVIRQLTDQVQDTELKGILEKFNFIMAVPVKTSNASRPGETTTTWIAAPIGQFDEVMLQQASAGHPSDLGVKLTVEISSRRR